ncbi:hypothetical protein MIND_00670600 [Mycena indigotica]|uniref:Uncharacterized protein n=1 Tax=Mycena indigotica TaxID=2126181 RepID=A0A8H6W121_9AGAR|nr:uncharacterized protein MIND_00670600 [Mycena indigotica]KAF7301067.1 hypothetical protein MIND_00670600 [Mycena indigotica]
MGSNDFGDLGIGVQGKVPPKDFHVVQMDALVVRSIVAGQRHVLVLLESGEVIGWGASRHGQLGNTVEKPCVNLPTNIPVGTGVVSIAAGHHHTVFLHQSGEVTGWGSNRKHQLNCLSAIRNAGGVHCTWNGSYVVTSDGYIHSTGNSIHGQLGRELEGHTRVQLPGHGLVQIACGSEHVLAVLRGKDGQFEVWGWGWNEHGNIGTGATEDVRLPQKLCSFDSHRPSIDKPTQIDALHLATMSTRRKLGKRSFTGNHSLLPAAGPAPTPFAPRLPTYTFLKWTFGRGSVIWKIWPAVLLHTAFAATIVYTWYATGETIEIPNAMLTVLGVVIGFVISYRASSGYDRYWMGRSAWSDVIRNSRTMGRLIWYHIPPRLTPGPGERSAHEYAKVMAEKRMALDLIEAYAVSLKHHLRGELGIYYDDLYNLVRPLHDFTDPNVPRPTIASAVPPTPPPAAPPPLSIPTPPPAAESASSSAISASTAQPSKPNKLTKRPPNPSQVSIHQPLLPAQDHRIAHQDSVMRRVNPDIVPFAGVISAVTGWFRGFWKENKADMDGHRQRDRSSRMRTWSGPIHPHGLAELEEFQKGENLPEEVLRCLSEWISVLEERGTVPGASLGSILGGIQAFEVSLTTLEHILTTPLPFVYSVHIRHVVWIYLFLLPFQLVGMFQWHTVPAVMVGSFVYLGFVAAGEEIEQPFGYDDNDLDLDMFCRDIIRQDILCLKQARCLNAWFPPTANIIQPNTEGLLSPPDAHPPAEGSVSTLATAYGGNMYRASLASLSDSVDENGEMPDEEDDTETEAEAEAEAQPNGGTSEGKLVDVS